MRYWNEKIVVTKDIDNVRDVETELTLLQNIIIERCKIDEMKAEEDLDKKLGDNDDSDSDFDIVDESDSDSDNSSSDDVAVSSNKNKNKNKNIKLNRHSIKKPGVSIMLSMKQQHSLEYRYDHLLLSLENEGFIKNGELWSNINKCKMESITNENWSYVNSQLRNILNDIRPFNVSKMLSLYNKSKHAARQVKNKNIALMLGNTGAGKSTTIHFLAGSKLAQDENSGHIRAISIPNQALQKVSIVWKVASSVTRYIAAVPISLEEAGVKINGNEDKKKMIVVLKIQLYYAIHQDLMIQVVMKLMLQIV